MEVEGAETKTPSKEEICRVELRIAEVESRLQYTVADDRERRTLRDCFLAAISAEVYTGATEPINSVVAQEILICRRDKTHETYLELADACAKWFES